MNQKAQVVTEEKLDETGAISKNSPQKSLKHLAQEIRVPKLLAHCHKTPHN
jgi:hypothetical protein